MKITLRGGPFDLKEVEIEPSNTFVVPIVSSLQFSAIVDPADLSDKKYAMYRRFFDEFDSHNFVYQYTLGA